jgi:hypothetical protein
MKKFNKVFCIGCHKTATKSLNSVFEKLSLKSTHSTIWSAMPIPNESLEEYDSFTDGGGHFWLGDSEFGRNHEVRRLDECYPNSKFILNTRDIDTWVVSKMLHAGWNRKTLLEKPLKNYSFDDWEHKSLEAVKMWVINRNKYHKAVLDYFADRSQDLLILNYIKSENAIEQIIRHLQLSETVRINKFHHNARKRKHKKHVEYCSKIMEIVFKELKIPKNEWKNDLLVSLEETVP